jgi:hypothetical protein
MIPQIAHEFHPKHNVPSIIVLTTVTVRIQEIRHWAKILAGFYITFTLSNPFTRTQLRPYGKKSEEIAALCVNLLADEMSLYIERVSR